MAISLISYLSNYGIGKISSYELGLLRKDCERFYARFGERSADPGHTLEFELDETLSCHVNTLACLLKKLETADQYQPQFPRSDFQSQPTSRYHAERMEAGRAVLSCDLLATDWLTLSYLKRVFEAPLPEKAVRTMTETGNIVECESSPDRIAQIDEYAALCKAVRSNRSLNAVFALAKEGHGKVESRGRG